MLTTLHEISLLYVCMYRTIELYSTVDWCRRSMFFGVSEAVKYLKFFSWAASSVNPIHCACCVNLSSCSESSKQTLPTRITKACREGTRYRSGQDGWSDWIATMGGREREYAHHIQYFTFPNVELKVCICGCYNHHFLPEWHCLFSLSLPRGP